MNKHIIYTFLSLCASIMCICRALYPDVSIWLGIIIVIFTGGWYILAALMKKTRTFHEYVGKSWIFFTAIFTVAYFAEFRNDWNKAGLFAISLCIGIPMIFLWIKDEATKCNCFNLKILCGLILISGSIGYSIMLFNESIIVNYEYKEVEITAKERSYHGTSFNEETYYIEVSQPDEIEFEIKNQSVSKEFYMSKEIGDKVEVCLCEGVLGKTIYFLCDGTEELIYLGN